MVLLQASVNFGDIITTLEEVGVFDYVLPFLLVFSIFFAILEKTQILGQGKTNINVVVSTVAALLLLVQRGIVETINLFIPRVSLIMIVILMGLLIIAMVSGKQFAGLSGWVFSIMVVLIIIAIILAVTLPETGGSFSLSPQDRAVLLNIGVPIAIFLIAVAIVTAKPKQQGRSGLQKAMEAIEHGFGGGGAH